MSWNYRILAHADMSDGIYLQVHEVYYDKNGIPDGYTENPIHIGSDTHEGITWTIDKIKECTHKPILYANERFPEIYKELN